KLPTMPRRPLKCFARIIEGLEQPFAHMPGAAQKRRKGKYRLAPVGRAMISWPELGYSGHAAAMSDAFSFVILLRVFYTGILVFLAIVLLREVWFVWFDRQMTIGEIKYFDGIKTEQTAADRFRHLLSQEYNHDLDQIRNYGR